MQLLPMADIPATSPRSTGQFEHGVFHQEATRSLPSQTNNEGGIQRPAEQGEVQGLWKAASGRAHRSWPETPTNSSGQARGSIVELNGKSIQDGAGQQGLPRVLAVAQVSASDGGALEVLGSVWGSKIRQKSMISSPQIGLQIGFQIGPQGPHYCSLNFPQFREQ